MNVYLLENRGNQIIMHWFVFVVAGLRDIPKGSNFHTVITEDFQRETLKLLEPDYHYVEPKEGDIIIKHHGAPLVGRFYVADPYYGFVREQILIKNQLENSAPPTRLLYISRSKAHTLAWRKALKPPRLVALVNENDVLDALRPLGFECIHLEDYSLVDKIKLFQEAKVIVGPSGGGFTMGFFANTKSHIIELRADGADQYHQVCKVLGIPITHYSNVRTTDFETHNIIVPDIPDLVRVCKTYV
jgi:capsular polysaccharide biosynthesis protein